MLSLKGKLAIDIIPALNIHVPTSRAFQGIAHSQPVFPMFFATKEHYFDSIELMETIQTISSVLIWRTRMFDNPCRFLVELSVSNGEITVLKCVDGDFR